MVLKNAFNSLLLQKTLIGGLLVVGIGYGIQLVLYVTCLLHLWWQRKSKGKITLYFSAYITVLLMLESLFVSAVTCMIEDIYINSHNYPGGPLAYIVVIGHSPQYVTLVASLIALTFFSDLLVLWRCWVIWSSSKRPIACTVITAPIILLIASLSLGIIWTLKSIQASSYTSNHLNLSLLTTIGTAYYVTSFGANILITALIILYLLLHRRRLLKTLPAAHGRGYLSVTTILIDSAALYSVFVLAFVVSFVLGSPMERIFLVVSSTCQQIAGYLIILRVAQGRAWNSAALTNSTDTQVTTLRFKTSVTGGHADTRRNVEDVESQRDYRPKDTPIPTFENP